MSHLVNVFPEVRSAKRLAIVAECPSKEDYNKGQAFQSNTANFIKALLGSVGCTPQACFMGYVYDKPAPWGTITKLRNPADINDSFDRLITDLHSFKPHCVLLMGAGALKVFGGTHSLDNFRGSLFKSPYGFKCIATYSPLHCFQKYLDTSLVKFDVARAWQESDSEELNLPERYLEIADNIGTAINFLNQVTAANKLLAFDVEGYPDAIGITCFSFAVDPAHACVIPLRRLNHSSVFSVTDEVLIWQKLAEILSSPVPKIAQNAMYELFIMSYRHGIVISNLSEDTMLKHWELYPELPKNLGVQTSLYTREPYFKDGRQARTDRGHWLYNAKDSAILIDINETTDKLLKKNPKALSSYRFKMRLLQPYTYMAVRGCRIDLNRLTNHRTRLWENILSLQAQLNKMVGKPINPKSSKDRKWLLYDRLGFIERKKGRGDDARTTADEEAVLVCRQNAREPETKEILTCLLRLTKARTDFSDTFKLEPFDDGRIRCSYNPVGTETGRVSSSATSVRDRILKAKIDMAATGQLSLKAVKKEGFRGTNLQNVSKWLRDVFIPDPGYSFWQYDFSGADAWTVAADLAALGYPAMLEHLQLGVKPSCVILMMQKYGVEVMHWSTDKILEVQPEMKSAGKMYTCAKACQHGSNYGMQPQLLADTIFKRSNGEILIDVKTASSLQRAYEAYYKVSVRTQWVSKQLSTFGYLDSASGTRRRFLGIRNNYKLEPSILRAALSQEPQNNTTYATNMALEKLYYSEWNRKPDGSLIIEPLLMIHDALAGQCPTELVPKLQPLIEKSFVATMIIHGLEITIPAEGGFADNWKAID